MQNATTARSRNGDGTLLCTLRILRICVKEIQRKVKEIKKKIQRKVNDSQRMRAEHFVERYQSVAGRCKHTSKFWSCGIVRRNDLVSRFFVLSSLCHYSSLDGGMSKTSREIAFGLFCLNEVVSYFCRPRKNVQPFASRYLL